MIRWCIIFFLFAASGERLTAQGFNRSYWLSSSRHSVSKSVIEMQPGKYVVSGLTYDTTQMPWHNRLTFLGLDAAGNVEWRKDYGDADVEYLDAWQGGNAFVKKDGDLYAALVQRDWNYTKYAHGVLLKMNDQGDTLWLKTFKDTGQDVVPLAICLSGDGGFLLTGLFQNWKTNKSPTLLIKTDANGNELWRKEIHKPTPDVSNGYSIVQDVVSKRIIISGYQFINTPSPDGFATFSNILILDSLGNKIVQKYFNNMGGGPSGTVIQLSDGNFVVVCQWLDHQIGANDFYKAMATKFDADGNAIWNRKLDPVGPYNTFSFVREHTGGNLYFLGQSDTLYYTFPQLICLDAMGNLMWQRMIGSKDSRISGNTCFEPTSDGFYLTALTFPNELRSPYKVIKIDSTGCDSTEAYCKEVALSIGDAVSATVLQAEFYPNPVSDQLHVKVNAELLPLLQLRIVDVTGKEMITQIEKKEDEFLIGMRGLPPGLYFVQVYRGDRLAGTGKVVKQ